MTESLAGKLLVASPTLLDPNFRRTVVLMCAHEEEGAFGVVLNRPLEADVLDHLPAWEHVAASPAVFFAGGPVEPATALAIGRIAAGAEPAEGWTAVTGPLGIVDLGKSPEDLAIEQVRIFAGHSGWGEGQLEAEIAEEAWFVVDSLPGDPFARDPERLWRDVLRRQPGRLKLLADFPPDPAMN